MFLEMITPETISSLGVGVAAILAIVYIIDSHCKERHQERLSRESQHKVFMDFVNTNNHKVTELVKESTTAIVASSKNIEESTKMIQRVCLILERLSK